MAERTPFERAFNPDYSGSLTGFMGALMGNKTSAERIGELKAAALRKFSELNTGGNPQQAFLELLKTPEGMAIFQSGDPNALKDLGQAIAHSTAPMPNAMTLGPGQRGLLYGPGGQIQQDIKNPQGIHYGTYSPGQTGVAWDQGKPVGTINVPGAPSVNTVPPGNDAIVTQGGKITDRYRNPALPSTTTTGPGAVSTTRDEQGNVIGQVRNPTAEAQNFQQYADFAKLPVERIREIAELNMIPDAAQKAEGLKKLEVAGILSPGMSALLNAGAIELQAIKDHWGKETGQFAVVDKARNTIHMLNATPAGAPTAEPGAPPSPENPGGYIDPARTRAFLGTGVVPRSLHYLNEFAETTFGVGYGTEKGRQATERAKVLENLSVAVTSVPEVAGRSNLVIKNMQQLLPKLWGSPLASVGAGINLHGLATQEIEANEQLITDRSGMVSPETRKKASERIAAMQRVTRSLPPLADMQKLREALIKDGAASEPGMDGGSYNVGTGIKAAGELGANIFTGMTDAFMGATATQPGLSKVPLPKRDPRKMGDISKMSFAQIEAIIQQGGLQPEQAAQIKQRIQVLRQEYMKRNRGGNE